MSDKRVPKFIPGKIQEWFLNFFEPFSSRLARLGISCVIWTILSTTSYFIAFLFILSNNTFLFSIFVLVGGFLDLMEHFVSGAGQNRSKIEDFTNAVFDRASEVLLFFGLMVFFIRHQSYTTACMAVVGLSAAMIANYIGLKAGQAGIPYKIGLFQRVERIILIAIGGIFGSLLLGILLWVSAILTVITALTRLFSVYTFKENSIIETGDES